MNTGESIPKEAQALRLENCCSMGVIAFKRLDWVDHTVHIMDMSESGVWIESDQAIEPGFVWFNDRVRGHKGGVLLWCREHEAKYRAIVQFIPLTREQERTIQERTLKSGQHHPRRSPEEIIAALIQSMDKRGIDAGEISTSS